MTAGLRPRDEPLDSLRGLDVLLMILVNVQGSAAVAYPFITHVAWHGVTLADFVFPVFLLVVGLSAPLALERGAAPVRWGGIVRRSLLLFAIGVALGIAIKASLQPDMIRWTGVLQRIAIVYLACAALIAWRRSVRAPALLAAILLALHSWLILHVGSPAGGGPSLAPGMGLSGWLDQHFIPGRVLRTTWEPEGVLSTMPAIANGLIGVAAMRWALARRPGPLLIGAAAGMLVIAGLALTPLLPLNKNLWTASFALLTSGAGLGCWALLRGLWPLLGNSAIAQWSVGLGQAALTLYVVHTLLIAILVRKLPDGTRIWDASFAWLAHTGLAPGLASMLYAVIAAAISCAVLVPLQRRGWLIKV